MLLPAIAQIGGEVEASERALIGRERELGEARNLLGTTRLLTLMGAGGLVSRAGKPKR